ncbi:MAG: amidase family protein, partial [Chloracidobacterium sp.]
PMARRVADLGLAMQVLTAAETPIPPDPSVPPVPWVEPEHAPSGQGLRVAYYLDNGLFSPSPAIRRAVREAADALERRGADVIPWTPPDVTEAFGLFIGILFADNLRYARDLLYAEPIWTPLWPFLVLSGLPNVVRDWLARLADVTGQRATARLLRAARSRTISMSSGAMSFSAPRTDYRRLPTARAPIRPRRPATRRCTTCWGCRLGWCRGRWLDPARKVTARMCSTLRDERPERSNARVPAYRLVSRLWRVPGVKT